MWLLSYAFILLVVAIGQLERLGQPLRWTVPPLFAGTLLGVLALRRDFRLRVPRHLPGADRGRRRRP